MSDVLVIIGVLLALSVSFWFAYNPRSVARAIAPVFGVAGSLFLGVGIVFTAIAIRLEDFR